MTVRAATLADASSIAALSIEVWVGTYLRRGINAHFADFVLSEFTAARTEALLSDPAQVLLVSENVDGIDGFIRLSTGTPDPVQGACDTEIATFYVQPRHHGTGVGTRLLHAAMAQCRAQGVTSVWLATNAENAPAIAFYLRRGFVQVGQTEFRIDDQAYLNNVYTLLLP
ncbi:GNAT family N-acetyltransferase [Jannaschia pohangensis]|uniref:Ribosomal protein S18 acetylase RimI n=1 Tax=Jannaschia pohangensis TaxID=390807 RepID=A0A1I3QW86_9RHOB|nr:GNAT family N-acetyltransferase [Jannaschia pohangensis]SFJ37752.1 Ribosomal protein S18 acetylase RimI [Jannaschia pohangensis]